MATIGFQGALTVAIGACVLGSAAAQTRAPAPAQVSQRAVPAETTAAAFVDKSWKVPRTSWGHPSFEGVWSTDDLRGVPMNRPAEQAGRESLTPEEFKKRATSDEGTRDFDVNVGTFLQHESGIRSFGYTSFVVDPPTGQMPKLTTHGEELAKQRTRGTFGPGPFDALTDFSLYDRCITRGVLGSLLPVIYGNGLRITQNPDSVAISYEMIHDTRVIPLDGRKPLDAGIRQYMGSARGHFEGDTLVVETTNFTDLTSIGVNGGGPPNSENLKLTERFRRVDPQMIEYRATIDDAGAYTSPFTIRLMITSRPNYEVLEYSCHEGNGAVHHALSGERAFERQVAAAKAKGLPIPERAVDHEQIRNGVPGEGQRVFDINRGE
jgi:hypothetical protein